LLGVVAAFVIGSQLWGASVSDLPVLLVGACAAALLTAGANGALCRWFRLSEEASVGLVFTALFSLGLVAVALYTKNVHLGVEAVLGNADALRPADVWLASGVAAVGIALSALFYPRLLASSFDATLCRLLSIRTGPVEWGLLFMTALTCIAAFRSVGVVVVLSLLTGPYLISRLFFDRLSRLLIAAPLVGIGVSALAVSLNRAFLTHTGIALSTGGLLATMLGALFALSLICRRAGKKLHF
jgi:manganese/zinc/iron transport system permease protein